MSEKSEPGRSTAVIGRVIVHGQNAANNVLVDVDTECEGQLFGDSAAAKLRIPTFHFDDGRDQFWRRSFRARLGATARREQQPVFSIHQRAVEAQNRA